MKNVKGEWKQFSSKIKQGEDHSKYLLGRSQEKHGFDKALAERIRDLPRIDTDGLTAIG
jgi:hypothetical protein